MRTLKVFGWTDSCPRELREWMPGVQARLIVAAHSKTEAGRIAGLAALFLRGYVAESRNEVELSVALAHPGRVFAAPLDDLKKAESYLPVPREGEMYITTRPSTPGLKCSRETAERKLAMYDARRSGGYKNQAIAAREDVKRVTGLGVRDLRKYLKALD